MAFNVKPHKDGTFSVCLPHQCQEWDIVGEFEYGTGEPQPEAIRLLEAFLADGAAALDALRRGEKYGDLDS